MSTLASLKLVASKKAKQSTPEVLRRNKLAAKLNEQIELAQAQKEGRPYAPKRIKTLGNLCKTRFSSIQLPVSA